MNRRLFRKFYGTTLFAETVAWQAGYSARTQGKLRAPDEHSAWWLDGWDCRHEELVAASRPYIPKLSRKR